MRIVLTRTAREHLREIHSFLAQYSEDAAKRRLRRLRDRWRMLAAHPRLGRVVPEYELERLREVVDPPYRIIYQVFADRIEIVAIRHSAELLQTMPDEL